MPLAPRLTSSIVERFERRLAPKFAGEIRTDRLSRALYATDASIYELAPDVVLLPKSAADVQEAVRACAELNVAITPRGAGTGLTGAAVNHGAQLDCSRHLNRILEIDTERRVAVVEPGVVLDQLNAALAPSGLQFAPDVATSSRATVGGMIANNSCGAHSVLYGRTVDHVLALDVVLSDGGLVRWGCDDHNSASNAFARRCELMLKEVVSQNADEIDRRFPKVLRSNAGYGLDRLAQSAASGQMNVHSVICGSEGTLGIVTRAWLKLIPTPTARGLLVVQFGALLDALAAVPAALEHGPAAVELIDDLILEAARKNLKLAAGGNVISGAPAAVLVIELYDEDAEQLDARLHALKNAMQAAQLGDRLSIVTDDAAQADVWTMRKAGLGLLMSRPGDRQPYAFVEDTAVDPSRLRDYIERFAEILASEDVGRAGYYAHASVGCLHVRPVLDLKNRDDVARMRRIAERISALAAEFGGTMTGEHGDGLLRSEWIEMLYGPQIVEAFRRIKRTFDPQGILNPGKIVDPPRMTEHLRYGPTFTPLRVVGDTALDFSAHGGMLGLAGMCSGVGQCRQKDVGAMCPSFEATCDETHTTRARANALRIAMSNRSLLADLDDPALDDVMDLCISCKACKTECPTGVDMARLKAEWLHRRNTAKGASLRSRLIAHTASLARIGARAPRLANAIAQSTLGRQLADSILGIDFRAPPPMLASRTFRQWFTNRPSASRGDTVVCRVIYFVDTWTDLFTPRVGVATVRTLEALGYDVVVPPPICCGRPAISKGMLDVARQQLESTVDALTPLLRDDVAIVGTEPSCLFTLVDELPQLVRTADARRIAARAKMIETFLVNAETIDVMTRRSDAPVQFHGHCHQKAMIGMSDAMTLLNRCGIDAAEINSGCCGMAGSFGHEREHYDVSKAIGESRLFPAVRAQPQSQIVVSGFSCRHQIAQHTQATAKHLMEVIAERIV